MKNITKLVLVFALTATSFFSCKNETKEQQEKSEVVETTTKTSQNKTEETTTKASTVLNANLATEADLNSLELPS